MLIANPEISDPMPYAVYSLMGSGAALGGSLVSQVSTNPTASNVGILIGIGGIITALGSIVIPYAKLKFDSTSIKAQLEDARKEAKEAKEEAVATRLENRQINEKMMAQSERIMALITVTSDRQIRHTDANRVIGENVQADVQKLETPVITTANEVKVIREAVVKPGA